MITYAEYLKKNGEIKFILKVLCTYNYHYTDSNGKSKKMNGNHYYLVPEDCGVGIYTEPNGFRITGMSNSLYNKFIIDEEINDDMPFIVGLYGGADQYGKDSSSHY